MVLTEFEKGMIVAFREVGWTYEQISKRIEKPKSTIADFFLNYKKRGFFERKSGSGRKRATTSRQDTDLVIKAKRRRVATAKELKNELDLNISSRTIRKRLNDAGFYSFFSVKKPFISKKNQKSRLAFAKKYVKKDLTFWRKVLWSDESPFVLRFNGKIRVWRLPHERYAPYCMRGTVKHDKKINVWGCFAAHGVGNIYTVNGNLDQHQFHQILQRQMFPSAKKLFPDGDFLFQQDNDPKHTAKKNQKYLENKKVNVLDWPSQSPDLNPIENLWSLLDKQLSERNPQNEDQLFEVIKTGWASLEVELLSKLVKSMPRRCQAVIDAKGLPTKY